MFLILLIPSKKKKNTQSKLIIFETKITYEDLGIAVFKHIHQKYLRRVYHIPVENANAMQPVIHPSKPRHADPNTLSRAT